MSAVFWNAWAGIAIALIAVAMLMAICMALLADVMEHASRLAVVAVAVALLAAATVPFLLEAAHQARP